MGGNFVFAILENMKKAWILFIFVLFAFSATVQSQPLRIHFLDVGEGDAILIETPNGKTVLVDAGNLITGLDVVRYLKKNNVYKLDHFILTHPHFDHIGGAFFVLQMLDTENIYDNGEDIKSIAKSEDMYRWYENLVRESDKYSVLKANNAISLGEVKLEILWPDKPFISSNFNVNSLVIMVKYKDFNCLLVGDSTFLTEAELLKKKNHLEADVLKVGHHGANDASSEDFLKAVSPKIIVISVGKDNIRGYPSSSVLRRLEEIGAEIYRTDRDGNIIIQIEDDGEFVAKTNK